MRFRTAIALAPQSPISFIAHLSPIATESAGSHDITEIIVVYSRHHPSHYEAVWSMNAINIASPKKFSLDEFCEGDSGGRSGIEKPAAVVGWSIVA